MRRVAYPLLSAICLIAGGCIREDEAAHEPHAKIQHTDPKAYAGDPAYGRDVKDQKATEADEAASKG